MAILPLKTPFSAVSVVENGASSLPSRGRSRGRRVPSHAVPAQGTALAIGDRPHGSKCAQKKSTPPWREGFLRMMPAIALHARVCFRRLDPEARAEAIQNSVANAMLAYVRLFELGKVELAYAAPLARYAVSQTREGRIVGNRMNARDVSSSYAQAKKGIVVERLDHFDVQENAWQEAVVQDTRSAPVPETVAFRVDFRAWLAQLPRRDRRVARFLVLGHRTLDAARKFGVSEARIAQLRRELPTPGLPSVARMVRRAGSIRWQREQQQRQDAQVALPTMGGGWGGFDYGGLGNGCRRWLKKNLATEVA